MIAFVREVFDGRGFVDHGGQTPLGKPIKPDIREVKAGSSRCASRCRCCCCGGGGGGGGSCLGSLSITSPPASRPCPGQNSSLAKKKNRNKHNIKTK